MVYNATVHAKYNENCEYRQSEIKETIPIDILQPVEITATIEPYEIKIGETVKINVHCTTQDTNIPVKSGYILINDLQTKCYLNNEGKVTIEYKPLTTDESIKITYHDTLGIFDTKEKTLTQLNNDFKINEISVNINIDDESTKTITSLQDPVKITVRVTDSRNGEPVTYGRITFLHYLYLPEETDEGIREDRIEKIIGNPVYLDADGYASINYIPMQDYEEDSDLEDYLEDKYKDYYVEYVRAVYNYEKDNSSKDDKHNNVMWKFYGSNSTLAYIYIKRDNYIQITGHYNDTNKTPLNFANYTDYIEAKDELLLKAKIFSDNEEVYFEDTDELQLRIHKTIVTPKNANPSNNINYDEYVRQHYNFTEEDEEVIAQYNENDNAFYVVLSNLAPGYYDIYATSNIEHGIQNNLTKYLQNIEESMHYYIQVKYNDNSNITIAFEEEYYETSTNEPITITVYIDNLTESQLTILSNKECFLQLPSSKKNTTLIRENNKLKAVFDNIIFESAKNYLIYAYINGIKQNNENIPSLYTNNIIVRVSGELIPSITANVKDVVYPGSIQYVASVSNLNNEIIEGYIYNYKKNGNKGEYVASHTFDIFNYQHQNTINNLDADTYTIDFDFNGANDTEEYTIDPASIDFNLSDALNQGIVAFPQQTASIILSSTGKNLSTIDINKLDICISPSGEENFNKRTINNINLININEEIKAMANFTLGEYIAGDWDIKIKYNGDTNFTYVDKTVSFTTVLLSPSYTISEDTENNITIKIDNPQLEYIPLLITLTDGSDIKKFIGVTDSSGYVTLKASDDKTLWNNLNKIVITTNPTNTSLINAVLNIDINTLDTQSILYDDFEEVFYGEYSIPTTEYIEDDENTTEQTIGDDEPTDNETITPENDVEPEPDPRAEVDTPRDERILTGLYNQLINYESTYLFTAYGENTKTYYR